MANFTEKEMFFVLKDLANSRDPRTRLRALRTLSVLAGEGNIYKDFQDQEFTEPDEE